MSAHSDGNEATAPVTPNVWAEHSVWPQDPGFATALAGGITSLQVLPGSANLIGGRGVTLKNVPATTYQAMKFPGAPWGLKMACGENPKRVYGQKGGPVDAHGQRRRLPRGVHRRQPSTCKNAQEPEAEEAAAMAATATAPTARRTPAASATSSSTRWPARSTATSSVHIHCYRADEMATMLDLAKEFGFKVAAFHHGVEAYKIADRLAAEGVCGALWADWWGFKMEAFDGIQENIALVDRPPNSCAIVHSDSDEGIQRLNQEAAKVMAHAQLAGMDIAPERAIRWLTQNPAKALGILDQTGTLEPGKMADVVLWNGKPFSVYAQGRAGLHRRRARVRPQRSARASRSRISCSARVRSAREVCDERALALQGARRGRAAALVAVPAPHRAGRADPQRHRAHRHARRARCRTPTCWCATASSAPSAPAWRRRPMRRWSTPGPAADAGAVRRHHRDRPGGSLRREEPPSTAR